jgi:cytochrome d ubiquinol oxidase subunit II
MTWLQITWFVLIVVLIAGYAVLDGFDLGVGFWHLLSRGDRERRILLNAIGPVWDGNEVWLLTGGGAIFAAFPPVYATVFSGLYLALMLVLTGLIFRAVSLEFRSKVESPRWRAAWDVAFSVGSIIPALLFGVAVGNIMRGLALDGSGNHTGTFLDLLNPYSLVTGLTGLAMMATHGALYLVIKTEGELALRARRWAAMAGIPYIALFLALTAWTFLGHPRLLANHLAFPVLFVLPVLALAGMVGALLALRARRDVMAFLASCVSTVALLATAAASLFPHMVPSLGDPSLGLTIYNSSSSQRTLTVMLVLAAVGVPVVLGYTAWAYRTFRGKVELDDASY